MAFLKITNVLNYFLRMQSVKTFSTVILVVVVFALFKCWFVCSFASKIWLFDVHVLLKFLKNIENTLKNF